MSIISSLKTLIGYSGSDLDQIFAVLSLFIMFYFVYSAFAILIGAFKR